MQHEKMKNERIDQLITEYLSGQLTAEAFRKLKDWSLESEENRRYVRDKIEVWFSSGAASNGKVFDKEEAFARFQKRVAKKRPKLYRFPCKIVYRVAVVILILLLPLAGYWKGQETLRQTFSDIVVEAPLGSRTKLYLPDGTLVWLNAGSKITYSQGFGMDNRQLTLEGEGYFEVVHNQELPFEIHTREVDLRVLGTKFNFKNYSDEDEATVNLLEGRVALHNGLKSMSDLYLSPNEKMVMNKHTGEMVKIKNRSEISRLWTHDELFFDEELLQDIAKKLMRSYDVEIEIADSLKNRRFYGSFKVRGNTIEEVLETIASTNRMKYRYENEKYILY